MHSDPSKSFEVNSSSQTFIQEIFEAISIPKNSLNEILSRECSQNESFITLKKRADEGSPVAQFQLGLCYAKGMEVKRSLRTRFSIF